MSSFLFLNTADRVGGSNTDALIYLANYDYIRGDVSVSVESFQMFSLQYPIRSPYNALMFMENGSSTVVTVSVTPGSYSGSSLAAALQTQINAYASNTYTVTFNITYQTISIATPIPNTIAILPYSSGSTLNNAIGFTSNHTNFLSAQTSDAVVNIAGELYCDVELRNFPNGNVISSYVSNSIFHRIPVDVGYGSLISFQNTLTNSSTVVSNEMLQQIQIRILNPDKSVYELPANFSVSIVLKIEPL